MAFIIVVLATHVVIGSLGVLHYFANKEEKQSRKIRRLKDREV